MTGQDEKRVLDRRHFIGAGTGAAILATTGSDPAVAQAASPPAQPPPDPGKVTVERLPAGILVIGIDRPQAQNRLGDNRRNRRSAPNGTHSRARSTARRILILARPSGRRACVNVNPELRSRARASRRSAVSFFTRRRSCTTSCWSSDTLRSVTSRLTTIFGALPRHPRAVERGTPRSVAMVTSPVPWTRSRSR